MSNELVSLLFLVTIKSLRFVMGSSVPQNSIPIVHLIRLLLLMGSYSSDQFHRDRDSRR